MTNSAPVSNFDSSDAKYTQIQAMSSGSPMSPIGVFKRYVTYGATESPSPDPSVNGFAM